MNIRIISFCTLLLLECFKPCFSQTQETGQKMSQKEIGLLIDSLSRALNRLYIYPDKAAIMINNVKEKYKTGAYNHTNRAGLSSRLDQDIQQAYQDKHLSIEYNPQLAELIETPVSDTDRESGRERFLNYARERNFAFTKAEILPGNIGYLRWDGFWEFVDEAKPTLDAGMQFVSNSKALIIDMRYNGGGSPSMVLQIQSYFFTKETRMNDIVDRSNDTLKRYADPAKTALKLNIPVYILTSRNTFSGAEDFAYGLQQVKRATIVGDTTGGGAHPTAGFSIGQGFIANIPTHRSPNIISKTDWEGTGVWPDVYAPSGQALAKAQILILTELISKSEDDDEKNTLQWNLKSLENNILLAQQMKNDSVKISKDILLSYCGEYHPSDPGIRLPPISILLRGNYLFRHLDGVIHDVRLIPVSTQKFVYDDESGRTMEFGMDRDGKPLNMLLTKQDGVFTLKKK